MLSSPRRPLTLCIAFALAACAQRHDEIAPELVAPESYAQATCRDLAQTLTRTRRNLIFSEIAQDKHYADDRIRTFGVPTPMATLFDPDTAPEVARLKGETRALALQMERAGCILPGR